MHHTVWSSPIGRRSRDTGRDALQRIADTLGVPVETFWRDARSKRHPDETAELIRLWFKIRDPEIRRQIIATVREAAAE